jgi:glycosyltransferase involved in cell wall biosynthesis
MSMKIALDSWVLSSRFRNHGIYTYARELFRELARRAAHQDVEFCLFTSPNSHNDAAQIPSHTKFEHRPSRLLTHKHFWRIAGACMAARGENADLLFAPSATVLPGQIPTVCTIHDATPFLHPSSGTTVELVQRLFLRSAAAGSEAIITVSEWSKRDLVQLLRIPENKIIVIYPGFDKTAFNPEAPDKAALTTLLNKLQITRPYILHHGVIQPRKNLKRLIDAYRVLAAERSSLDLDLVLAGPLGWNVQEVLEAVTRSSMGSHVVLTGALPQHELALLIKAARLSVIPSLYEGFCLPLIESMACGTPTIAANNSCLPEVSGSTLLYFDPLSVEEMAACMRRAIEDSGLRSEISRRGQDYVTRYDWGQCADGTLQVLKRVAAAA